MNYPTTDLDTIREKIDLVELVGELVELRRRGRSWVGLCPFHDERTPSFTIQVGIPYYHCFGCGEGGDAFKFIQQVEHCSFPEAIVLLAERAKVELHPTSGRDTEVVATKGLAELVEAASKWFGEQLHSPEARQAREFIANRGFDRAAAKRFGLGYAPKAGLLRALTDQGYKPEDIVTAGLATKSQRGVYRDFFQDRVLWPLRTPFGRTVGFGARRLSDSDPIDAKFINTSETPLFRKSTVLFGIEHARKEIAKTRHAIVVEGYTDVMAEHQAGITNAVASCGTAFTSDHLSMLRKMVGESGEITFAFDGDSAGMKAALAVYDLARTSLRRLSCITLPGGMDPDDLRRDKGDAALRDLVDQRRPLIEMVLTTTINATIPEPASASPEDRRLALDKVLPILGHVEDRLVLRDYATMVAKHIGYDPDLVFQAIVPAPVTDGPDVGAASRVYAARTARDDLILLATRHRAVATEHLEAMTPHFQSEQTKTVLTAMGAAIWNDDGAPWLAQVVQALPEGSSDLAHRLLSSDVPDLDHEHALIYAAELIDVLAAETRAQEMADLRERIGNATTPEEKAAALNDLLLRKKGTRTS